MRLRLAGLLAFTEFVDLTSHIVYTFCPMSEEE
jgi:hypothetical protein